MRRNLQQRVRAMYADRCVCVCVRAPLLDRVPEVVLRRVLHSAAVQEPQVSLRRVV